MAGPRPVSKWSTWVWVAGPSCAAVLADWGADVIKIEPPEGTRFEGWAPRSGADEPAVRAGQPGEAEHRAEPGVEDARYVAGDLIDAADVFVTNMRPRALEKYGLTYEKLKDTNPR